MSTGTLLEPLVDNRGSAVFVALLEILMCVHMWVQADGEGGQSHMCVCF